MDTPSENRQLKKKFKRSLRNGDDYMEILLEPHIASRGQLIPQSRFVLVSSLEAQFSGVKPDAGKTSTFHQNTRNNQDHVDGDVGTNSSINKDNVKSYFGKFSLHSGSVKNPKEDPPTKIQKA